MAAENEPLVSVLSPHWNRPEHLRAFLKAMAEQTYPAFELLVHDDGSSAGVWDVVRDTWVRYGPAAHGRFLLQHERTYPKNAPPGHPGLARWATQYNRMFPHATGEIVGILSSDWVPERNFLEAVVFELTELGPGNMVFGAVRDQAELWEPKGPIPVDATTGTYPIDRYEVADTRNQNFIWREDWQPWDESFDAFGFGHAMPFWLAQTMHVGVKFWCCLDMQAGENVHDNPGEFIEQIEASNPHYQAKLQELRA